MNVVGFAVKFHQIAVKLFHQIGENFFESHQHHIGYNIVPIFCYQDQVIIEVEKISTRRFPQEKGFAIEKESGLETSQETSENQTPTC